jgi:hypothetical protein
MAAMDALEIPDGNNGAAQLPAMGRGIERVMNCDETWTYSGFCNHINRLAVPVDRRFRPVPTRGERLRPRARTS